MQGFGCLIFQRVEVALSQQHSPWFSYQTFFPCDLSLNLSFITTQNILAYEFSIPKVSMSKCLFRVLDTLESHLRIQQKLTNVKSKESNTPPPPSHFSCVCEMNFSGVAAFSWEGKSVTSCELQLCCLLSCEKLRKATERRRGFMVEYELGSQAQRSHLAA